jgi:hypothetical protein
MAHQPACPDPASAVSIGWSCAETERSTSIMPGSRAERDADDVHPTGAPLEGSARSLRIPCAEGRAERERPTTPPACEGHR